MEELETTSSTSSIFTIFLSTPPSTQILNLSLKFNLLKNYFNFYKLPIIISRFSNFYGPGQPVYRLIPKIIACIDKNKKFSVEGNGRSKRNFIFSHDFCNGMNLLEDPNISGVEI